MGNTIQAYVVQRLSWEYNDDFYSRSEDDDAPLKTFLDRAKAEAHRRQLEWEHVGERQINPFGWIDAGLEERSSLPREELLAHLQGAGMRLEGEGDEMRRNLWEQYDQLPEEGRRLVWEAIDRIRFFGLLEVTVDLDG